MTDDLKQTGKLDDTRIHIEWNHEVSYWSKRFNVSPEQLRKAVELVGPLVKDVKRQQGASVPGLPLPDAAFQERHEDRYAGQRQDFDEDIQEVELKGRVAKKEKQGHLGGPTPPFHTG
jgi:uncharacterized protein DUF3606